MRTLNIILIIAVILSVTGYIETTSNGRHSGQISAVEKNGIIWQTWDVYVKSDISSSQEDKYCVEDASLIPQLQSLSENRNKTTLLYRDEFMVAPWRCGNDEVGIITGIENIK